MEIILKKEVQNLGSKDDLVTVKQGYARNYLIPQGYAVIASESAKKMMAENIRQRAHKEAKLKAEAEQVAKKLNDIKVVIGAKTSSAGKIFGSVNNIQLAEKIAEQGVDIERKNITIPKEGVKEVGTHTAKVKLHREVVIDFEFEVVSE
ncbi:MAG: 50S ribosomal protein L9 [Prolixibacteraceae bacterium]|jgi:large subunit ribosomal protein L9|nr:50S ribosomal protein L9 [Prolixibacteraceae bacterium]